MQFTIDGGLSLEDQENTLNFAEKGAPLKLISYTRAVPPPPAPPASGATATQPVVAHNNIASFERRDQTALLPLLVLLELPAGQTIGNLLSQHAGKQLVFVSDIWVASKIKKVVCVR